MPRTRQCDTWTGLLGWKDGRRVEGQRTRFSGVFLNLARESLHEGMDGAKMVDTRNRDETYEGISVLLLKILEWLQVAPAVRAFEHESRCSNRLQPVLGRA